MARASLSDEEVEQMRLRLAQAALELYTEQGYEAVSFRELAQRLGISHTLPYRYFDNKEALFAQVRSGGFLRIRAMLEASDPRHLAAPQRLLVLGNATVDWVKAHAAEYRLMFSMQQPPLERYPELLRARRAAFGYLVEVVRDGVRQGTMQGDPLTVMHIAWVSVHGLLTLHAADQLVHGRSLDQLMPPLLETVIGRHLRAPAAQPSTKSGGARGARRGGARS
jgi:AcrR family transcriptional regulator